MNNEFRMPMYRMKEHETGITVEHIQETPYLPDYTVFNCWASCNCRTGQPIDLVFDIHDNETGATFKNVKGQCNLNEVSFTFGPDVLPEERPTDLGEIKTFVC